MNTNQVGQSMSRGRNEHLVKSVVVGSRKSFIYIGTAVPNLQKKKKEKKKGQWYRYHSYWYRYHPRKKRQWPFGTGTVGRKRADLGFFCPNWNPSHISHPPLLYKTNPNSLFSLTRANPRSHVPVNVFISLIRILLSSSHRRGKHPSFP